LKKIRQVGWKKLIPLRFFWGWIGRKKQSPTHIAETNLRDGKGIGCHVLTTDLFLNF